MKLSTKWIVEDTPYLGPELRPHFILEKWRVEESALVAFRGPCEVQTGHLVDWEDRLEQDFIRAKSMLHFLGEFFGMGIREGVYLQRLFVALAQDELRQRCPNLQVLRKGDDLYWLPPLTGLRECALDRKKVNTHGDLGQGSLGVLNSPMQGLESKDVLNETSTTKGTSLKLNVSIFTISPVSGLLHFGINIDSSGAPVPAAGLNDLLIDDVQGFAETLLNRFSEEWAQIHRACTKVRPVL